MVGGGGYRAVSGGESKGLSRLDAKGRESPHHVRQALTGSVSLSPKRGLGCTAEGC